jgi:site-specific DNA recombinase
VNNQSLKFFIYCRKSTEAEDRQMLSIDAQLSELKRIALENELNVVGILSESKSAKEPGREVFNELLLRIKSGEGNGILSWKLDRLARNLDDGGKIIDWLQRGVIREIRTFEKLYLPSDNVLLMAVEFGMANQYVRDLSINICRGIREKIRRGIYYGKAPLGYFNEPKLRTIEPHPKNFAKMKQILEMFATGRFSLTAIQRKLWDAGIVGNLSKKPLHLATIGHLLRNPFYYGVFLHKGEMHQGVHIPMISKQTFDGIQKALVTNGKPRKHRHDKGFLFLNFATCGSCGHCITAEQHVKKSGLRFCYYRCTHKNKKHHCEDRGFVRDSAFAKEVKRNTELVSLPDEWKERFLARIETWEKETWIVSKEQMECLTAALVSLRSRIDRLNTGFADGVIEVQEFKDIKNPLVVKKREIEEKITILEKTQATRLEPLKNWVLEANQAQKWASEENWMEMKSFLEKVGSNRLLRAQTLTVSFKKPWNLLAETVVAARSTEPVSATNSKWWRRRELNPRPWQINQPRLHA